MAAPAGHRYWLIQAASAVGGQDIVGYPASAPWGPFDVGAARVLYRDPSIGLDAAHDYRIMYEARAEPALSTRDTLVISYNVNSEAVSTGCKPMSAFTNSVTLPRFAAVPMAAFGQAGVPASAARGGATEYPQIVARNPGQWFDSWEYKDGCPPVPGLPSVHARTAAGRVTLSWPDVGLGMRYSVSMQGPRDTPVTTEYHNSATITGLPPGQYRATVMPFNFKKMTGQAAEVSFTVP